MVRPFHEYEEDYIAKKSFNSRICCCKIFKFNKWLLVFIPIRNHCTVDMKPIAVNDRRNIWLWSKTNSVMRFLIASATTNARKVLKMLYFSEVYQLGGIRPVNARDMMEDNLTLPP